MTKNILLHRGRDGFLILLSIIVISALTMLSGCATVGPDYFQPNMELPGRWSNDMPGEQVEISKTAEISEWWQNLNDPVLTNLIEKAVSGSLRVQEAVLRIEESRARSGITKADQYPSVSGSTSVGHSYSGGRSSERYSIGMDSSWEIDLFGGIRRSIEASDAELASAEESLNDIMISLVAEVALNYVDLRTNQSRLSVALNNIGIQEETFNLVSWRYEAGLVTALDYESAKSNLEQTRSQVPSLRSAVNAAQNRMAVLLGLPAGELSEMLKDERPIPGAPKELFVGLPADLLRRRPDLRKAERDLAAQTARVGIAVSERYPKIRLTGSIGLDSLSAGDLLKSGSRTHNVGPSVSLPIFRAGAISRNIEVQTIIEEQRLVQYKSAVLNALEEVENALSSSAGETARRESLKKAAESAERSLELSLIQYSSGLIDFQVLLDSQRTVLSLRDQLSQSEGQMTINYINLYKAIGGGWTKAETDI